MQIDILKKYQTPMYIFNIDILKERIEYLKEHLPNNVSICYAMKANPFLVKEVSKWIDKLEVCSPGEYYICDEMNIDVNNLVISGVYKTPKVIEEMFVKKVKVYTVESMTQFQWLHSYSVQYQFSIEVLLRLTSGNQFGMSQEEIKELIKNRNDYPFIHIKGIQYFSGTQKTSIKRLLKELTLLDHFILELKEDLNYEIKELEFGPGFPVSYFQNNKDFDEDVFLDEFSGILNSLHYQGNIILELGRSLTANCGVYVSQVVDTKVNQNGHFAILDGGMHHLSYYGQMMAMKHPFYEIYPPRKNNQPIDWNLCGSLCTINDLIVKQIPVTNLKIGDIFIFKNTGAYCMTEGISLFLSRDLPQVLFIKNNEVEVVRKDIDTFHLNLAHYERRR